MDFQPPPSIPSNGGMQFFLQLKMTELQEAQRTLQEVQERNRKQKEDRKKEKEEFHEEIARRHEQIAKLEKKRDELRDKIENFRYVPPVYKPSASFTTESHGEHNPSRSSPPLRDSLSTRQSWNEQKEKEDTEEEEEYFDIPPEEDHSGGELSCPICAATLPNSEELQVHWFTSHPEETPEKKKGVWEKVLNLFK